MKQLALPPFDVYVRGTKMPARGKTPPDVAHDRKVDAAKARAVEDGWKGFVNVELTEAQKAEAKKLRENVGACWGVVFDLVEGEYKLSVSLDAKNNAYVVSMTGRKARDVNAGLTLTARGGTIEGALASFVYKHQVILEGDWTSAARRGGGGFDADDIG